MKMSKHKRRTKEVKRQDLLMDEHQVVDAVLSSNRSGGINAVFR